jgi:hypothetical protein
MFVKSFLINLFIYFSARLENWEYGRTDSSHSPRVSLYPQKLAITSPTSGGRSVGIVRSRTQATEFIIYFLASTQSSLGSVLEFSLCYAQDNFN